MDVPTEFEQGFADSLLRWWSWDLRDLPWRKQANLTPYRILVAELLLKRTTAAAAARSYLAFLTEYPDLESLCATTTARLEARFAQVGLHRQRAKSTSNLARYLTEQHQSTLPDLLEDLLRVPSIGPYSARAILSFGFDKPNAVVDSNVQRIFRRFHGVQPSESNKISDDQALVDQLLPIHAHRQFNFAMIDLGSLVCRPVSPDCQRCPLSETCNYRSVGSASSVSGPSVIAVKMREKRKAKGFSLTALASITGLSKATIINLEKGRTNPSQNTVKRISSVLER